MVAADAVLVAMVAADVVWVVVLGVVAAVGNIALLTVMMVESIVVVAVGLVIEKIIVVVEMTAGNVVTCVAVD